MTSLDFMRSISISNSSKIVMVVIDGLGGLPLSGTGKTELESARRPNLNALAGKSECGLSYPVGRGITPGSAPGHLALFGYDPLNCNVGRGVLEAMGIGFDLTPGDVAARGNFCTIDSSGRLVDRRAGRLSTEESSRICQVLDSMLIDGVRVFVRPSKEHRIVVVFRGEGLSEMVSDSDPQQVGVLPKSVSAQNKESEKTAAVANKFLARAKEILSGQKLANMILLRGFSKLPCLPTMNDIFQLTPAAIAVYPMYRGLAKVVGMDILPAGMTIADEVMNLSRYFADYDFFFLHVKGTDSAGEDGDFERKVTVIEEFDQSLDDILALNPEVLVVTGDHSTPAIFKGHSWHPVPLLIYSKWCRPGDLMDFSERSCLRGSLGHVDATDVLPLAMAHAQKLNKFGA